MTLSISALTLEHVSAAMQLVGIAGWNQTPRDWQRVIEYQPDGCFCATIGSQFVGTVTSTCYGRDMAWIGMMLVHPDARRQGIGQQLMERVISHLQTNHIRVIALDATPLGRPLYERLGFKALFDFQRWQRPEQNRSSVDQPLEVKATAVARLQAFLQTSFDREAFGAERSVWLNRVAHDSDLVLCDERGFGMRRPGRIADYVGPIVSYDSQTAVAMLEALTDSTSRSLIWDLVQAEPTVVAWAEQHAFQPMRVLTRMVLGDETIHADLTRQYALCDPASG